LEKQEVKLKPLPCACVLAGDTQKLRHLHYLTRNKEDINLKRLVLLTLSLVMILSVFAGCAGSPPASSAPAPAPAAPAPAAPAPAAPEPAAPAAPEAPAAAPEAPPELSGDLRFSWWGNEARSEATIKAIEQYEAMNPGVTITPEYSTIDGFYNKLMTQIAGNNAPDIMSVNVEWLPVIAQQGGFMDLTNLVDVSTHNEQVAQTGYIDGKLYGVGISLNANVVYYNQTQADELGITVPQDGMTWDQFIAICQEVYEKSGKKTYGMVDLRMVMGQETWAPALLKTKFGLAPPYPWTDEKVIMTGKDITDYMAFLGNMPEGVVQPPELSATIMSHVETMISKRETFFHFEYSGTFSMVQAQTTDVLNMIEWPTDKAGPGNAVSARPGMQLSVFSGSKFQDVGVDFIDYFANSPEAGKILTTVRGVLPSSTQREAVMNEPGLLSENDQKIFAITDKVYSKGVDPFYAGPVGAGTLFSENNLVPVGHKVAFGEMTPEEAGAEFDRLVVEVLANASANA
jgi:multiple sugar transport system substrate-binding protein